MALDSKNTAQHSQVPSNNARNSVQLGHSFLSDKELFPQWNSQRKIVEIQCITLHSLHSVTNLEKSSNKSHQTRSGLSSQMKTLQRLDLRTKPSGIRLHKDNWTDHNEPLTTLSIRNLLPDFFLFIKLSLLHSQIYFSIVRVSSNFFIMWYIIFEMSQSKCFTFLRFCSWTNGIVAYIISIIFWNRCDNFSYLIRNKGNIQICINHGLYLWTM